MPFCGWRLKLQGQDRIKLVYRSSKIDSSHHRLLNSPLDNSISFLLQIRVEAAFLYDAVHLYADALINCLENHKDPKNGTEIINAIKGRSYQSAMGLAIKSK